MTASGRGALFALLALVTALLAVTGSGPAMAQQQETPSFIEVCADKTEERGRLRYCDAYFREALGARADPVLYLRDRITRLRASQEANAEDNYESFLTAVAITAFLTIATMILVISERRITGIAKWSTATSALALLVIIATMTIGWLEKYRAEDAAMLELGLLRDQIETEASQVIVTGGALSDAQIQRWTDRLHEIGQRFAENYGNSSIVPDLDRFSPKN